MSLESVDARIAAIQAQIDALRAGGATTRAGSASFADTLSSAQSASPVASAASATPASSAPAVGGSSATTPFNAEIEAAAARNGVDPALLKGLIRQESRFNPGARSGAGAMGLTQLMPGTAASLGVTNPLDPAQSAEGGAKYLRQMLDRFGGDTAKALAAYNAGPGAVEKFGGVPPYAETQNYVQKVMAYAQQYRSSGGGPVASAAALTSPLAGAATAGSPVATSPAQFGIV